MWKLFIAILAMSDTGNVSSNLVITDYNSHSDCMTAAKVMSTRTVQSNGTNQVTVVVTAQCTGDFIPTPPPPQMPPLLGRRWQ